MTRVGATLLALVASLSIGAPYLAPNDPSLPFADRVYAPPTRIYVHDAGGWRAPFIYQTVVTDRLLRQFGEDTSRRVPLRWGRDGLLVTTDRGVGPLLLLGADALGRDILRCRSDAGPRDRRPLVRRRIKRYRRCAERQSQRYLGAH